MKYKYFTTFSFLILLVIIGLPNLGLAEEEHSLLGITLGNSRLVSFDPYAGLVTEVHAQLNPSETFTGLAYDPNHNRLYALAQITNNLYSIDLLSLDIVHIGNLHIDKSLSWGEDTTSLAYDPIEDKLYTAIGHWDSDFTNIWSELCEINVNNGELRRKEIIYGPYISSLHFNTQDEYLYGLAVYGSGSWDSPYKSHVVRISPHNAVMDILFETPYHTMLGFAKKPDENSYIFYTWINWTSHFYGEVDIDSETITPLGNSDQVDVISAMVYRDFDLGSIPLLPVGEHPISFSFTVQVLGFSDPANLLGNALIPGDKLPGRLTYDLYGLFNNSTVPYEISVLIENNEFSSKGFYINTKNNYYNSYDKTVSDCFILDTYSTNNIFPIPTFENFISWELTDYSSSALSNIIFLPNNFDLSSWGKNTFSIGGDYFSDNDYVNFYIWGSVESITTIPQIVNLDIKPGACPNPLRLNCNGKLPVTILGTDKFEITTINPDTIMLTREGVEGFVPLIRHSYKDVGTPLEGELCDCHNLRKDGYMDLSLKFMISELVDELMLYDIKDRETIPLTIVGETYDGTPIKGEDCIWLIGDLTKECQSDLDCDADVDGSDARTFKNNFGRSSLHSPSDDENLCDGDFDGDKDVDGNDAFILKSEFGTMLL